MRRLTIVLAFVFVFTAAFAHLERMYSQKFLDITGRAQWIWAQHRMSDNLPVAFFAAREFELPERRIFTHLKVAGDPEYTVYVNGVEVAGRQVTEDRTIDLYDISDRVKTGRNRLVIAVRAPRGVGGLLAAIDIAPETANWIVTDGRWTIYREWDPVLLHYDAANVRSERPAIVGEPPIGRWNYLTVRQQPLREPVKEVFPPRDSFPRMGIIPRISTQGGVAVAVAAKARATAFDFGFTEGRIRLTKESDHIVSRAVNIRFANAEHELGLMEWNLRPVVFAPGELEVTTPESHKFRYAMVFGKGVQAVVVR